MKNVTSKIMNLKPCVYYENLHKLNDKWFVYLTLNLELRIKVRPYWGVITQIQTGFKT